MKEKKLLIVGISLVLLFIIWTILISSIDVHPIGQQGTVVGFATFNSFFYRLTGVNMIIYYITDWLGLVPIFCCLFFGVLGFLQLIKRRNIFKVDYDIVFLGIYYLVVIFGYLVFEMIPINYRPILIDGIMEVSYPSSTTMLTLSVMSTVIFQARRRIKSMIVSKIIVAFVVLFLLFMIIGRTISGVHWLTDIIGSLIFSSGLYLIYQSSVLLIDKKQGVYYGI